MLVMLGSGVKVIQHDRRTDRQGQKDEQMNGQIVTDGSSIYSFRIKPTKSNFKSCLFLFFQDISLFFLSFTLNFVSIQTMVSIVPFRKHTLFVLAVYFVHKLYQCIYTEKEEKVLEQTNIFFFMFMYQSELSYLNHQEFLYLISDQWFWYLGHYQFCSYLLSYLN